MKNLFLLIAVILIIGCTSKHDPRIIGTFISDKASTVEYLEVSGKFTEHQIKIFSDLLGKLIVTCDGETVTWTLDDYTDSEPLKIVNRTDDYIEIESKVLGETMRQKIIFTQDGYWIIGGMAGPNYREKFIRVSQQPPAQGPQKAGGPGSGEVIN